MDLDGRCPHCGDISTTVDICSECGQSMSPEVSMISIPVAPPPSHVSGSLGSSATVEMACPVCAEHRASLQDRFCSTCRYDYVLRKPFGEDAVLSPAHIEIPVVPVPVVVVPMPSSPPLVGVPADAPSDDTIVSQPAAPAGVRDVSPASFTRWEATAVADPSLCEPGVDEPSDTRPRVFPIDFPENMVGRKPVGGVHPEIALADPGISRRHARIDRGTDGRLMIMDLGSTNGTKVNGQALEANLPVELFNDDIILLGSYTRMTIRGH